MPCGAITKAHMFTEEHGNEKDTVRLPWQDSGEF